MAQLWGFLGEILGPLIKTNLLLIENVHNSLAKSVLVPLELTAAASETDAAIQKKVFKSGMTKIINSDEEMNDIKKIIKCLEESGSLIKCVSKTIKNEVKEQKECFLVIMLDTLGASLLGNMLVEKSVLRAGKETSFYAASSFNSF